MQTQDGWTALMVTAKHNHITLVHQLLEMKAQVNLQTIEGWTALMLASWNGYAEIVENF